jgi:predicted dehydrogenase
MAVMPGVTFAAPRNRGAKLRVAGIGCGGQAMHDLGQISRDADIVALAEVDAKRGGEAFQRWPDAKKYTDFREMLDKELDNIDAVCVATPDHIHAIAALAAMQRGKHVYVEKPMAHNIAEVYALMKAAEEHGVITQMGNQGHSMRGCYEMKAAFEQGYIGDIQEVHCWTNRPTWPQGVATPTAGEPIPETLAWDTWLGPAADRPYSPVYCPHKWRGWWDFGCGALGDMGCHILDAPFYALSLTPPTRITSEAQGATEGAGPTSAITRFEFPANGKRGAFTLTWYEGDKRIPEQLTEGQEIGTPDGGSLFIGSKGKMHTGCYGLPVKPLPDRDDYVRPEYEFDSPGGHQGGWVKGCLEGKKCVSDFSYAGPLTEVVLLGVVSQRVPVPLEYDPATRRFTNNETANQYLSREYRPGWELGKI